MQSKGIRISAFGSLEDILGDTSLEDVPRDGIPLKDVLAEIGLKKGKDMARLVDLILEGRFVVLVNGRNISSLKGFDTVLWPGDHILITLPLSGGM